MSWNYRMTRERLTGGEYIYAIREVYYQRRGEEMAIGWTDPVELRLDDPHELVLDVELIHERVHENPILDINTREDIPWPKKEHNDG